MRAHLHYTDFAWTYFEFGFMNDKTHQAIAPTAAFTTGNPNTGGPYFVNCGNPFLSAQEQGILGCTAAQISAANQADPANQVPIVIGRRNIEGGPRSSDYEHSNYRMVLGIKGEDHAVVAMLVVGGARTALRSEEHTSELQSQSNLVCRLLLEKKKNTY